MSDKTPTTLRNIWREAWAWMKSIGVPLKAEQEEEIKTYYLPEGYKRTPHQMAYFLTEHYENMKEPPTPELKLVIDAYKRKMMEKWGWPTWGYKGIVK